MRIRIGIAVTGQQTGSLRADMAEYGLKRRDTRRRGPGQSARRDEQRLVSRDSYGRHASGIEPPFFIPMFPPIQVPQNFNQPQHVLGDGYYSWMNANPGKWVTQSFNLGLSQFTGGSNNYSFLPNFTNPAQFSYQAGPFYVHGSFSPSGGMPPIKAIIGDFQHPSNFFNYQQFISGFNFRLQLMYGTGQSSSTAPSSSTSPCDNIENTLNLIPGPGPK